LLDHLVEIVCGSQLLEITSIVGPFPEDTLQESYAIHLSAWKGNSENFALKGFSRVVTANHTQVNPQRALN
jgi:hypothetical protein